MRSAAWLAAVAAGIGAPTFVLCDLREFTTLGPDASRWLVCQVATAPGG